MISLLKRQWKFLLIQNSSQPLTNGPRASSRDTLCCVWKIKDLFVLVFILVTRLKYLVPSFTVLQADFNMAQ